MRFRGFFAAFGLLLLLAATTGVKGCREETARTFNPNRPPDTYLTGAPVESTVANYLFHMYWTGTDPDGEVVGYYIAITDSTMPTMEPHPDSMKWTTRTDTSVAFKVAGTKNTLSERFYVWAVDNEGRMDPTPAWVFFDAWDRYFPEPIFLESQAVEYRKDGTTRVYPITDTETEDGIRDTVPIFYPDEMDSVVVRFRWTGRDKDRYGFVTGFRYRMTGDAGYTEVLGVDTLGVAYRSLPSGVQTFKLAALDDGGAMTDPDSVRVFVNNFDPETSFDPEFVEFRPVGGETLEIVHHEGDTVAVGSLVQFCVNGHDPDGDDGLLQYSHVILTTKACGGGDAPPFSFFDTENTGPRYCYTVQMTRNPKQSGMHRAWARAKDEHGRVERRFPEFIFYSNLPPSIPLRLVRLNRFYTIESSKVRASNGEISVNVKAAEDPDPGNAGGDLEYQVHLKGVGNSYDFTTEWAPTSSEVTLTGVSPGRYHITITISDVGCRELILENEFDVTT